MKKSESILAEILQNCARFQEKSLSLQQHNDIKGLRA